jgi:hypothetical protein
MQYIKLSDIKTNEVIAVAEIKMDEYGYLYLDQGSTFDFEFECALYGYQEGRVNTDTIDDDDNKPYIRWTIIDC